MCASFSCEFSGKRTFGAITFDYQLGKKKLKSWPKKNRDFLNTRKTSCILPEKGRNLTDDFIAY